MWYMFRSEESLVRQVSSHPGGMNHPCNQCGKCFSRKGHLARHVTIHTGVRKQLHVSMVISVVFCRNSLGRPNEDPHGGKPFQCDLCGKVFSETELI